jgi:UDP:flavonoid glycosyltransferase YjiC (YdhE family)
MSEPLTVLLMPESAYGPTNNCVGIGKVLRQRGHHVVFSAEASWKGKLAALGFDEALVDPAPPTEGAATGDGQRTHRTYASRHIQSVKSNTKLVLITVTDRNHSGTRLGHDRDRWT